MSGPGLVVVNLVPRIGAGQMEVTGLVTLIGVPVSLTILVVIFISIIRMLWDSGMTTLKIKN